MSEIQLITLDHALLARIVFLLTERMGSEPLATRMAVRAILAISVFHRSQGVTSYWRVGGTVALRQFNLFLALGFTGHCCPFLSNINLFDDLSTDFYPSPNSHITHLHTQTNKPKNHYRYFKHLYVIFFRMTAMPAHCHHLVILPSNNLDLTTKAHQKRFHPVR
jgi:hypothetical protein